MAIQYAFTNAKFTPPPTKPQHNIVNDEYCTAKLDSQSIMRDSLMHCHSLVRPSQWNLLNDTANEIHDIFLLVCVCLYLSVCVLSLQTISKIVFLCGTHRQINGCIERDVPFI